MVGKNNVSSEIAEAWSKLQRGWSGEHTDAFHREYIVKMNETAEEFESACCELNQISATLSKEMTLIEYSLNNI